LRRDDTQPTVVWNADVSVEILAQFEAMFPMNGSRTWAITVGLEKFLERAEANPVFLRAVHVGVEQMLADPDDIHKRSINLRIPSALYTRFNKILPEWGATTWFIRHLLQQMLTEAAAASFSLDDLLDHSVRNILQADPSTPIHPSHGTDLADTNGAGIE
jgi:hypothetical protein